VTAILHLFLSFAFLHKVELQGASKSIK